MGRPPAVIIVTRHGARLDAADKHWHLTSPAPYDSPLTYGGWIQCRALGGKIASLLRARELLFEQTVKDSIQAQSDGKDTKHGIDLQQKRKKHRVIIHSSPFLRCVQTSVAIAAGISQYRDYENKNDEDRAGEPAQNSARPNKAGRPKLASIQDEDEESATSQPRVNATDATYIKPRLRIDAFLGEWLSPDYYESITPPPNSVMMVATAKAELLRRGEHIQISEEPKRTSSVRGHFPGGWSDRPTSIGSHQSEADDLGSRLADTDINQPGPSARHRAHTQGDISSHGDRISRMEHIPVRTGTGYIPPVPPYAVASTEPIPAGYVQHARDACVDVDFQWDSMRAPQDWGDGGELEEEWSAMHKRFRKGLHSMVSWYALHHESALQSHGRSRVLHPHPQEPDDEDTDLVVVLVTHGAGCNALIGALTNQPVLLDVVMASLTMAVFREREDASEGPRTSYSPISPSLPRYANERPLSADYTVTLTASVDHLTHNPFIPVSLAELKSQPRIPTESSVVRRSSRRRFNPAAVIAAHDRSASLSQLPTKFDPTQPRLGISRSDTASTDGGSSVGEAGVLPRVGPDGVPTTTAASAAPTSAPGLWSRPVTREGPSHPRTWSLLSQGSTVSTDLTTTSTNTTIVPGMVDSPVDTVFNNKKKKIEPEQPPDTVKELQQQQEQQQHAIVSDSESISPPLTPLYRPDTITMDADEVTERERGAKRRWTTSQGDEARGEWREG